ncbi:MAG TPA: VOC family protein [Acidimicrobiales bacterium]|nr:VOC family protein [Acidimicrobiales bacterium]
MELAKPHLDCGLYTDHIDAMRAFYGETVGLPYEELLKAGGGIHQHRYGLRGAVLKVNASRDPLADDPTTLRRLLIADERAAEPQVLADPEGLAVTLVPPGAFGVDTVGVQWASTDPDRLGRLLAEGFDAVPVDDDAWRVGTTLLLVEHDPDAHHAGLRARGFRYLTVQVRDVRAEHARLVELGWSEQSKPIRLGDVAYISFVRDPDGTPIEISQRASLTGPLPAG